MVHSFVDRQKQMRMGHSDKKASGESKRASHEASYCLKEIAGSSEIPPLKEIAAS